MLYMSYAGYPTPLFSKIEACTDFFEVDTILMVLICITNFTYITP